MSELPRELEEEFKKIFGDKQNQLRDYYEYG